MQLQRNETVTGLLVLLTVAALTAILIALGAPGLFRPLATYKLYFDNAAGIKLGAPVLLAGRKIGQVTRLYSPVSKEESARAMQAPNAARIAPDMPDEKPEDRPKKQPFEARVEVDVDRTALVYKDSKVRMMSLGLLGETAIDITEGNESAGRAQSGEVFAGERVPEFGEAISKMLDIISPVAKEATNTMKELQTTAQNLSKITDKDSELNLALAQFKEFGEHISTITAPDSPLSQSLNHIQELSRQLTENNNIQITLQNFRDSSEKLKLAVGNLGPDLQASARNVKDATDTLRSQPWRLLWPATKRYDDQPAGGDTITVRKSTKAQRRNGAATQPTPPARKRPWAIFP